MAKKERILYGIKGFSSWPVRRYINEAENVARWSPWAGISWMEDARQQLSLDTPFYKEFDQACARINARWKNKERYTWFNLSDFWAANEDYQETLNMSFYPRYLESSTGIIEFDNTIFLHNQ